MQIQKEGLILFLIMAICWFGAQFLKLLFTKKNSLNLKEFLIGTGGMPSSHSASVVSLPTFLFLYEGISVLFVVTLAMAILTIRDSFGVRFAVGENAKLLEKTLPKEYQDDVVVSFGHTILESAAGSLFGILLTILLYFWLV